MTNPEGPNPAPQTVTNGPQPAPRQDPPTPPPVTVNAPPQNPALHETINSMGQTLAGLPERIVDALREATKAPEPPATAAPTPATTPTPTPTDTPEKLSRRQRFHRAWFGGE
jgi:hypothetical protein